MSLHRANFSLPDLILFKPLFCLKVVPCFYEQCIKPFDGVSEKMGSVATQNIWHMGPTGLGGREQEDTKVEIVGKFHFFDKMSVKCLTRGQAINKDNPEVQGRK